MFTNKYKINVSSAYVISYSVNGWIKSIIDFLHTRAENHKIISKG